MPQSAPSQQPPKPATSLRGGPAGALVTVSMAGLPAAQSVRLGFGNLSQYEVLGRTDADGEGRFSADLQVPAWAEVDRVHFFVVSFGNVMPRVLSEPFHVTDPDGVAHVYGTINDQGVSCVAVDGPNDTTYTLQGNHRTWGAGQRVLVVGTIADAHACGGQGVPLVVREITANL